MDKEILVQYSEVKEEIKDIRRRIEQIKKEIANLQIVSDSVKGTKKDGTYGNIKITGYPTPMYFKKKAALERNLFQLEEKEIELLDLTNQAEEFIENIPKSELRFMFRLYYIDDLTWVQVAHRMNQAFPKRKIKYTEDSCRMRNSRFFEEN